jgi:hypothetical protein
MFHIVARKKRNIYLLHTHSNSHIRDTPLHYVVRVGGGGRGGVWRVYEDQYLD